MEAHVLIANMHHIISDAWSTGILVSELSQLYKAFSEYKPSPLEDLEIQYVDYAYWQRQWLSGDVLAQQAKFWKEHLSGAPALLELPTDRPRPNIQGFRGATLDLFFEAELTEKLNAVSRENGATLFMTLLSSFALLLSNYSRQQDIVIGSPIANRFRG